MKVGIAGIGAFGLKHLEAISHISGVEVVCITGGRDTARLEAIARRFKVPAVLPSLEACLALPEIDAIILCGPTQVHAAQALACLQAGKHVQVEIPMADNLADARALAAKQQETGLVAMAGHTRRYNPSHQWIHHRIQRGELVLQQLDVQTYFFRRSNVNAEGQPRSWTDHLLWHHACHTVDLFQYQTGEVAQEVHGMQGPLHPALGIAMDMSVQLKVASGALCTLSLSFNNQGPQGTFFRYICDNGTYIARYDELVDGEGKVIDVSGVDVSLNGIELQDREFFAAIQEHREPRSGMARVLPAYETLDRIEKDLEMTSDSLTPEQRAELLRAILKSPSYRLAYHDAEFMRDEDLRPVRLQLELLKPESYLRENHIDSTIVVYGSARVLSPVEAQKRFDEASDYLANHPGDAQAEQSFKVAQRHVHYSRYYEEARRFSYLISQRFQADNPCQFVVVTGGGPGIMEAGNRGAFDAGAKSIGLNITLPHEQVPNPFITPTLCFHFHYFALRKMHFMLRARALVAFPGGFGTLDELFEALTLVQTEKMSRMPIILVGRDYWSRLIDFDFMVEEGMISQADRELVTVVETAEEILSLLEAFYANCADRPFPGEPV